MFDEISLIFLRIKENLGIRCYLLYGGPWIYTLNFNMVVLDFDISQHLLQVLDHHIAKSHFIIIRQIRMLFSVIYLSDAPVPHVSYHPRRP